MDMTDEEKRKQWIAGAVKAIDELEQQVAFLKNELEKCQANKNVILKALKDAINNR